MEGLGVSAAVMEAARRALSRRCARLRDFATELVVTHGSSPTDAGDPFRAKLDSRSAFAPAWRSRAAPCVIALSAALMTSCNEAPASAPAPAPADEATATTGRVLGDVLPPRTPRAGVAGFRMVLDVRFAAAPQEPHRLELVQVFPQRAYWCMSHNGAAGPSRILDLQAGAKAWHQGDRDAAAADLGDVERSDFERRAALRQALVLWPDDMAWQSVAPLSAAESETEYCAPLADDGSSASKGSVSIWLGRDGKPVRAAVARPGGEVQEELRRLEWHEYEGRSWPSRAELWVAGEQVWSEELVSASSRIVFQDSFFLPRREARPSPAR